MQLFIVVFCLVTKYYFHRPWLVVGLCFLVMQVFSILGAAWGSTIQRRLEENQYDSPDRRR